METGGVPEERYVLPRDGCNTPETCLLFTPCGVLELPALAIQHRTFSLASELNKLLVHFINSY